MASLSLRAMCADVGLATPVSVCRDLLGFSRGTVPRRLNPARPHTSVSLKTHGQRLALRRFDLALILAGSDLMGAIDERQTDYAIWRLREIYAPAGITVRRVHRHPILAADAQGHAVITTDAELEDTGHDLTVDGDVLPVVLPAAMNVTTTNPDGTVSVTLGLSPLGGPCGDRDGEGMRSAVVMVDGEETARTLAHEIGHYLGADHPSTAGTNLMAQTGAAEDANGGDAFDAVTIVGVDAKVMRGHCTITVPAADKKTYDPAAFSVAELEDAMRGRSDVLAPTLAVTLLRAKLGGRAEPSLTRLALDASIDVRARRTAVTALGELPGSRATLERLARSAPDLVADAARAALGRGA